MKELAHLSRETARVQLTERIFTGLATSAAFFAGQPAAFAIALSVILLWLAGGPLFHYSDTWQLVVNTATTIATFLMVFLIQNSQNRDAAALQAKLDELIRSVSSARNEFIGIEHLTDSEIEAIRTALERETDAPHGRHHQAQSMRRLLERR